MSKTQQRPVAMCSMHHSFGRHGDRIGMVACRRPAAKWVAGQGYCPDHYLDAAYMMAQQLAALARSDAESLSAILAARAAKTAAIFRRLTGQSLADYEARKGARR